ncbi:MAG: hypothetical protein FJ010_10960 [Chloroflexi bacterium]|nr:hypothetical protein [Chloroflexota bacterium]
MDDSLLFLITAVISVAIGYLAGSLLSRGRDSQEEKKPAESPAPMFPSDALHIWRDDQQKQLVLQIGKRAFHSGEPLPPTEGTYLAGLLAYLQKWLGMPASTIPASSPGAQPAQAPATPQTSVSPFVLDAPEEPAAERSIVAQVDEILQELLFDSPLRDRGIRLMENLDGSMRIFVGLDNYSEIDSIPDDDIKALIRAAVRKWEQRQ